MRLLHIGRALDNEIVVNDTTVSRRHAQLVIQDDGAVQLIDLNSSNGTFVNGHRVNGQVRLDRTDIVKVGDHLLPWRNYVQVPAAAPVGAAHATVVAPPQPQPPAGKVEPLANLSPKAEVPATPAHRSGRLMIWLAGVLAFAGVGVIIIVMLFLVVVPKNTSDDITGRWRGIDNPLAWVEFNSDHSHREGYGDVILLKDATWSTSGGRTLLIKREGTTVVKEYFYDEGILTLRQGNNATTYKAD